MAKAMEIRGIKYHHKFKRTGNIHLFRPKTRQKLPEKEYSFEFDRMTRLLCARERIFEDGTLWYWMTDDTFTHMLPRYKDGFYDEYYAKEKANPCSFMNQPFYNDPLYEQFINSGFFH